MAQEINLYVCTVVHCGCGSYVRYCFYVLLEFTSMHLDVMYYDCALVNLYLLQTNGICFSPITDSVAHAPWALGHDVANKPMRPISGFSLVCAVVHLFSIDSIGLPSRTGLPFDTGQPNTKIRRRVSQEQILWEFSYRTINWIRESRS
jgi:hypothetical protein